MLQALSSPPHAQSVPIRASAWRTLLSPPLNGVDNMACDAGLMDRARATGEAVLRIYSWSAPTLSFGRNQTTSGYDRTRLASSGLAVVRRPTGGRAILHHHEITYSVTAPVACRESVAAEYSWINGLLLRALRILGVEAEIAPRSGREAPPDANPCFASASPGEITVASRKLVGSAQYREDGALLQHGSVLISDDQAAIAKLAGGPAAEPPATLLDALGRAPRPVELLEALGGALCEAGIHATQLEDTDVSSATARHLPTFADPEWTWRR